MKSFFYFAPDRQAISPADIAALGLSYAFEWGADCTQVERGPEGKRGVVFAQQDSYELGKCGYHEKQQIWRQIPGKDVLVGHYVGELPGPEDLARQKLLSAVSLELDDGQRWLIPRARSYSEKMAGEDLEIYWSIRLPQRLDLAADGKWTSTSVTPRYAALFELAEAWVRLRDQSASEDDRRRFDYQGEIDGAVLVLQANYRIGRVETALLGCLNDDLAVKLLDELIDLDSLLALTKKKAALIQATNASTPPAGCSSSAGPAAEIPITDPPAPTSPA
jgi:hypothetical protein